MRACEHFAEMSASLYETIRTEYARAVHSLLSLEEDNLRACLDNEVNVGWVKRSATHHENRQGYRFIMCPRFKETCLHADTHRQASGACRFGGLRAIALTYPTLFPPREGMGQVTMYLLSL